MAYVIIPSHHWLVYLVFLSLTAKISQGTLVMTLQGEPQTPRNVKDVKREIVGTPPP